MSENSESRYVAEPLTDLTDEEWEYIRYVGAQIMARNPKPLGFEEWKNQEREEKL